MMFHHFSLGGADHMRQTRPVTHTEVPFTRPLCSCPHNTSTGTHTMPRMPDYVASPRHSHLNTSVTSPHHTTILGELAGKVDIWDRTPDRFLHSLQSHRDHAAAAANHRLQQPRPISPPREPPPRPLSPHREPGTPGREVRAPGTVAITQLNTFAGNTQPASSRVSCGMCCNVVDAPLRLECGHLFCAPCLAPSCVQQEGATVPPSSIQCSLCDCKSRAPLGIDAATSALLATLPKSPRQQHYPTPTHIVNGASGTAAALATAERIPQYCDWCEKERPEAFCEDCRTALCGACTKAVHAKRGMSMHNIVSVLQCDRAGPTKGYAKCALPGHERGSLKYFCRMCYEPACSTCVAEVHRGHGGIIEIEELIPEILASVKKQEGKVADIKHSLKELVSGNQQTRMQFNTTAVAFEHQVKHLFTSLKRELQHQEDSILESFRNKFKGGRATLLHSTDSVLDELDTANVQLIDLQRDIFFLSGEGNNAAIGGVTPAAAVVTHLKAARQPERKPPSVTGLSVPRGTGFTFTIPTVPQLDVGKLFGLKLDLSGETGQRLYAPLTFPTPPPQSSLAIKVREGATDIHFSQMMDWSSLRCNEVFTAAGVQQWRLHLSTFDVMIGVVSADERDRPDLHQGNSFFWYVDVSDNAFGTLGSSTAAFESLPPLHTLDQGKGVDVVLRYDGAAQTLSCAVQGVDKGVIGRGITPPVQPAFAFVSGEQKVSLLY